MMFKFFLGFFILLPSLCFSQTNSFDTLITQTFRQSKNQSSFSLGERFIFKGSEKVKLNSSLLLKDRDYFIDYDNQILKLEKPLSFSDTLVVTFMAFKGILKKRYFHREVVYQKSSDFSLKPKIKEEISSAKEEFLPKDFLLSGSKTFSFQVGSQKDFSLNQGLNLSLSGQIAEKASLTALLSDQGEPAISGEATTKRIEELDKVLIELKSPHFQGSLGDYYLDFNQAQLSSYEKKLKGVKSNLDYKDFSWAFAIASSKGEYFTNKFDGTEGKQGPYQLQGKKGESNISILPGTEKVWLDGELLTRGADNDYLIDYDLATLVFTSKKLISGESRVNVDFEYSKDSYEKDFYFSSGKFLFLDQKGILRASFIREEENKNSPLVYLSNEDKHILSQSGDSSSLANRSGAQFVGEGKGRYNLSLDSLGNQIYQYAGVDSGTYEVSYSWVGEGKGSYIYKGLGIYEYVYPNQGSYLPLVFLPLPSSHTVFDLGLSLKPQKDMSLNLEWGKSKKDLNTFSSLDDQNNGGEAILADYSFAKKEFDFLGTSLNAFNLQGNFRLLQKNFNPIGRLDYVEKERIWDLPIQLPWGEEKRWGWSGTFSPKSFFSLSGEFGKLDFKNKFSSQREKVSVAFLPFKKSNWEAYLEKIESRQKDAALSDSTTGKWIRRGINLNNGFAKLNSILGWESENKKTNSLFSSSNGFKFDQFRFGFSGNNLGSLDFFTELLFRFQDQLQSFWKKDFFSRVWQNRLTLNDWRKLLSGNIEYTRRGKDLAETPFFDNKENLLKCKLNFYPLNQGINLNLVFSVNQIQAETIVQNYVKVDAGKGNYKYQNGEYVPDPLGDYILVTERLGDFGSTKELSKEIRLAFTPSKMGLRNKGSFWNNFSTETQIKSTGKIKGKIPWWRFATNPLSLGEESQTIFKNASLRQDLYLFTLKRRVSFRFRFDQSKRKNDLLLAGAEKEENLSVGVLTRAQINSKNILEVETKKEKNSKSSNYSNYRIFGWGVELNFTHRESEKIELGILSQAKKEDEREKQISSWLFLLSPRIILSIVSNGRIKAEFKWWQVQLNPKNSFIPFQMAEGKKQGENFAFNLGVNYKINQYITSSLSYEGTKEPLQKIRHLGKAEIKAYF